MLQMAVWQIIILIKLSQSALITLQNSTEIIAILYYQNGSTNPSFSPTWPTFSCANQHLFVYYQNYSLDNPENPQYFLNISGIDGIYNVNLIPKIAKNIIYPVANPTPALTQCHGKCLIPVSNNCKNARSYGGVSIHISALPDVILTYGIVCNDNITLSPFQGGLIILVFVSLLQIVIVSNFQKLESYGNKGHCINCYSMLGGCLVFIIGQVLILSQINSKVQDSILYYGSLTLSIICGTMAILICTAQFLYWTKKNIFRVEIGYGKFKARLMDIFGLILGLGIVAGWIFSGKNWIISDIIEIAMFTAAIKIFKFDSLKIALIAYICIGLTDIPFIIATSITKRAYFNNIILSIFNIPFFVMCPVINYFPNQTCSWFFITSAAFPAAILSYLRRFDGNTSACIYSVVFMVSFTIVAIAWIVMSIFVPFTIPFNLVTSPICLLLLLYFANRRGQLRLIWSGQIYDKQHKNKLQYEQDIRKALKQKGENKLSKNQIFEIMMNENRQQIQTSKYQSHYEMGQRNIEKEKIRSNTSNLSYQTE